MFSKHNLKAGVILNWEEVGIIGKNSTKLVGCNDFVGQIIMYKN